LDFVVFVPRLVELPTLAMLLLLLPFHLRLEDEALDEPRELAEQTEATPDDATAIALVALVTEGRGPAGDADSKMGPTAVPAEAATVPGCCSI
jgi:hypothetical protein